jgi:hypothetical protein
MLLIAENSLSLYPDTARVRSNSVSSLARPSGTVSLIIHNSGAVFLDPPYIVRAIDSPRGMDLRNGPDADLFLEDTDNAPRIWCPVDATETEICGE